MLTQQVSHLEIRGFGFSGYREGWPLDLDEEILIPQLEVLEEALRCTGERLEFLYLDLLYPQECHTYSRFEDFVRRILPRASCISEIHLPEYLEPLAEDHLRALQALHPAIKTLSIQKHLLEASDIKGLGKKASEEEDHPLACLSQLLEDDEVAERIVEMWNEKYAPS